MKKITKTLIRETLNHYDFAQGYGRKTKCNPTQHSVIVSNGLEQLIKWLQDNRLSYTDKVNFYRDGSSVHLITVGFNQLHYLNKSNISVALN